MGEGTIWWCRMFPAGPIPLLTYSGHGTARDVVSYLEYWFKVIDQAGRLIIARHLIDQMIAHAQAEAPLECCGIIATRPRTCPDCGGTGERYLSEALCHYCDGEGELPAEAVRLYPATNAAESEYRYEINGVEQMVIASDIEDEGLEIGGIYHSHTHAPPIPSLTDVVSAAHPDAVYVILGRFSTIQAEPVARAYRINGSTWTEEPLDIRG